MCFQSIPVVTSVRKQYHDVKRTPTSRRLNKPHPCICPPLWVCGSASLQSAKQISLLFMQKFNLVPPGTHGNMDKTPKYCYSSFAIMKPLFPTHPAIQGEEAGLGSSLEKMEIYSAVAWHHPHYI